MNPIQLWWRLARFRPDLYTLDHIFYFAYTLSLAFSGIILRAFFDHLGDEPGTWALGWIVLLQVGNTVLAMVGLGGANFFGPYAYRYSQRALLFGNIFAQILAQPGAQPLPVASGSPEEVPDTAADTSRISVGEALNTLRDDIEQTFWFDIELADLFGFGLTAIIALIAMFQVSIPITLGVFAPLIVIIWVTERLSERIERYRVARREAAAHATSAIGDIFGAVQAIQVNNAEERMLAHFRRLNDARRQASVRDQLLTRLVDAIAGNMVVIGTALLLILSAQAMQAGRFTVGDFALFVAYIWPVTILFQNIGNQIALYQQTAVSIRRLQHLMQGAEPAQLAIHKPVYLKGALPELPNRSELPEGHLEFLEVCNLTYHYPGTNQGIQCINLQIKRGSLTVITGEIGSGKTTLLQVLLGLLPIDAGEIRWNGKQIEDPATFFVPPRCAYTPQTPHLFSESLRDNILMGLPEQEFDVDAAIKQAILEPDLATMKQGLDTRIGPRGMRLSGGQVQRTAAARMFVRQTQLFVFDDLSSALDLETEQLLWGRLLRVRNSDVGVGNPRTHGESAEINRQSSIKNHQLDVTCLVVSHRQALLERADQVVVLRDGKVVECAD